MYEPGMKVVDYDLFFDTLKEKARPFAKKAALKQPFPSTKKPFDVEKQKNLISTSLKVFDYNLDQGVLKESSHPFTSGVASIDTRINNRLSRF